MPAQAIADTPPLLTINCISGVVGGPSLGKLTRDIAARCENVRFSLAGYTEKGTPLHKPAYCEPTTVTFQNLPCQLCSLTNEAAVGEESKAFHQPG
ncbi:hypothetical protein HaLaN_05009, partial [Haematococcus lacustris]